MMTSSPSRAMSLSGSIGDRAGFANTDLDLQLKQHGVRHIVLIGMIANTCIEATGRFGMELGYHVSLVKDATAAFSAEAMHAAHAIVTTEELLAQLFANQRCGKFRIWPISHVGNFATEKIAPLGLLQAHTKPEI